MFTDEATFRMNGYVKRPNCHICIEKCPREIYERVRNFQKVNLRSSIIQYNVIEHFFLLKIIIRENICMDMLQIFV